MRYQAKPHSDANPLASEWGKNRVESGAYTEIREYFEAIFNEVMASIRRRQPHLESPQDRQVIQPSIITTATVLHLLHNCAPSG